MGNWNPFCCPGECWNVSDNFDRDDAATPGDNWNVIAGDWQIESNRLTAAAWQGQGYAYPLVIHKTRHPKNTASCLAYVDLVDIQEDAAYVLVVNYEDEDNYLSAQYLWDGSKGYLSVHSRIGGVSGQLDVCDDVGLVDSGSRFTVCRMSGGIEARLATKVSWGCFADDDAAPSGRKAGLGNFGETKVTYDNFKFEEHFITNADCPRCYCDCSDNCVPRTLHMTWEASGDCASCLDGQSFSEELESCNATDVGPKTWVFTCSLLTCDECAKPAIDYEFELICPDGSDTRDCDEWLLVADDVWGPDCGEDWEESYEQEGGATLVASYPSSCQCSPFQLVFGPFDVTRPGGGTVCTYTITITE